MNATSNPAPTDSGQSHPILAGPMAPPLPRMAVIPGVVGIVIAMVSATLVSCGGQSVTTLNGEQGKSAAQVLNDAHTALAGVHTLHFEANYLAPDNNVQVRMSGDLNIGAGAAAVHFSSDSSSGDFHIKLAVVVVPGAAFFMGDAGFYAELGSNNELAGKWWQYPSLPDCSSLSQLGYFGDIIPGSYCLVADLLNSTHLVDCVLGGDAGTLNTKGSVTVSGQTALEIVSAGHGPGSERRTIDVSLSGVAYPVRVVASGPAQLGGTVPLTCFGNDARNSHAEVILGRFDQPNTITRPSFLVPAPTPN